jgi:succinoglycan biosynthesis transport protein ExoP
VAAPQRESFDPLPLQPVSTPLRRHSAPAALASAGPPALNNTPDALSLLRALKRRWVLAFSLGIVLAGFAGAAAYFALPAKFTAFAIMQVSSQSGGPFGRQDNRSEFGTYIKTLAGRLKSREVLVKTISQDQVRHLRLIKKHPDALSTLTWMEENLKVEFSDNSELLTVSLTGEEQNDLQVIVNGLTKSFLDTINKQELKTRSETVDKVKLLYATSKEKLTEKFNAKEELLRAQGFKDQLALMQHQQNIQNQLQRVQDQLSSYQLEVSKKQAQLANLQATQKKLQTEPGPDASEKEMLDGDQELRTLQAKILRHERAVDIMEKAGHRETDSNLVQAKSDFAASKKKFDDRLKEVRQEFGRKNAQKQMGEIANAINLLQVELVPWEKHFEKMLEREKDLGDKVANFKDSVNRHSLLDGEIKQLEASTDDLHKRLKEAEIAAAAGARITPIGEAELQPRDVKKRVMFLLAAPIFGLCLAMFGVSWWECSARRIHEPEEVVASLAMRVVGQVPEMPDPKRRGAHDPQEEEIYRHNLVESIDAIRTMLLRSDGSEPIRVVMVTSAVSGEGKTTLASNLAMSLARAGRRTLLVDCDLRRPAAHQLFEQTLQPGFSEVVLQEVELPDAVRPTTADPNLFLLPAGQWDREVVQELAKSGVTSIFEKLRSEFDFIVVDSHPVLPATDSLLIAQQVDAVILSLMRDVSQMHLVHDACQQLSTLGIRLFGAVVNGVPVKIYGKSYQYTTPPQPTPAA